VLLAKIVRADPVKEEFTTENTEVAEEDGGIGGSTDRREK
jgi:hypothetical protein